ncbi:glycosyltransferase family A protein [Proteiniphilum sp. UBA1028]|uniref:glycosyltransferase family A protein n=1 Tax=Proteiniphilum sp. UBA1028 TaxID=1947251 RepID=UPI000E961627|nr:glycosyltransferase family A protein [Proteiniphilum sp. UBA1028]HBG59078.1 family 2 glycosyl transferase [Porphyromonadaceae bacterium]
MKKLHVITPVKNSVKTTLRTIESVCTSRMATELRYTVYDDFSDEETIEALLEAKERFNFELVHLSSLTQHPSPNYLLVLQLAQQKALADDAHLVIVESDVVIQPDTLQTMQERAHLLPNTAMLGAVTTDETENFNYPYLYAKNYAFGSIKSPKRISFCCTLLSNDLLSKFDFQLLNKGKTWFDVFISHKALELGMSNYVLTDTPVLHYPHSSRPWKNLKKTNPLLYYWQKLVLRRDKI